MSKIGRALINERVVITLILVNAFVVFLRSFQSIRASNESALFALDFACTLYFLLEMVIKMRLEGWRAYLSQGWNRFDLVIVLVSSPMLLSPFVAFDSFAAILVLRLARVARFLRLLRFVPDSERVWSGVKRGLRASLGVGLALALYCFALSLAACQLFGEALPARFGDPFVSFYALFQVFTVEGWQDIADEVTQSHAPDIATFARLFFMIAVGSGGILGLSIANAVFVDEMVMDNTDPLEASVHRLRAELAALREEQSQALARIEVMLRASVHTETPPAEPTRDEMT